MRHRFEQLLILSTGIGVTSSFQYHHSTYNCHDNTWQRIAGNNASTATRRRKLQGIKYNDKRCNSIQYSESKTVCLATLAKEYFKIKLEPETKATSSNINSKGGARRQHSNTMVTATITGHHLSYYSALKVLQTYHSIHGDLVIPRRYVVPSSSNYPPEWHGLQIGSTVYNMKWWIQHVQSKPERVCELNQLGFVWERLQPEYNLVLEALITYKALHGHVQVPASFIVPYYQETQTEGEVGSTDSWTDEEGTNNYPWPKATWGIPLGNCVHRIRSRGDFLRNEEIAFSRRRQLDNLGFVWDVSEAAFSKFLTALRFYNRLGYDDTRKNKRTAAMRRAIKVKTTFVIPSGEWLTNTSRNTQNEIETSTQKIKNPWPRELWGYPLGARCSQVRQKGLYIKNHPQRQKALQEIGFQIDGGNATLGWLEVVHAAAIYSKMHGRVLDVPSNFVVPKPPRPSCEAYRMLLSTGADDVWPWPESLWGLQLGQRLKDVRLKSAYLTNEKTANSRRAQLDALGFVWKPKRGRRKRSLGGDATA